jgi:predicted phosphodiesterase
MTEKQRIASLARTVASLTAQLAVARKGKAVIPKGPRRTFAKGFCRVIVTDTHGSSIDPRAAKAFLDDLEQINPAEVVMLGDHIDCGGFLAPHLRDDYVAELAYTVEGDVGAANEFLDSVQSRAPGAKIHYLEGNHEFRIQKFVVDQARGNVFDASWLAKMFSPPAVLNLQKRKITYYPQEGIYFDTENRGVIQLGKCRFMHGRYCTKNAAKSHLDEYVCNIVFGHTHRADSYIRRTMDDTFGAWNPGCLCITQPYYQHTANTHHTHGYGLQVVQGDGSFLHLNIPIIAGRSYLSPLASQLAA